MKTDALQFFSLLKQKQVSLVPWSILDKESVFKLFTDFKLMNKERVEELEKTRIESANQSAIDFLLGRDSFNPPNSEALDNMMGGGLLALVSSKRRSNRSSTASFQRSL